MPRILFVKECPYLDRMAAAGAEAVSLGGAPRPRRGAGPRTPRSCSRATSRNKCCARGRRMKSRRRRARGRRGRRRPAARGEPQPRRRQGNAGGELRGVCAGGAGRLTAPPASGYDAPTLTGGPTMTTTVTEPQAQAEVAWRDDSRDEMWHGRLVMSPQRKHGTPPLPGRNHGGGCSPPSRGRPGVGVYTDYNLSDRVEGWAKNFRLPDVGVYLAGNPAIDHGTHMQGGPDLGRRGCQRGPRTRTPSSTSTPWSTPARC